MRVVNYAVTAAVFVALCGTAHAQAQTTPITQTGGVTTPEPVGETMSHWTASGFVGSSFNSGADNTNGTHNGGVDFGGQIAYLWKGIVGPEFIANFAPSVKSSNEFLVDDPRVHSYMGNALAVVPLGAKGRVQPFVSGGFGTVQMRTTFSPLLIPTPVDEVSTTSTSNVTSRQSSGGTNIGFGLMGFVGRIGFRGDMRYFHTSTVTTFSSTAPADQATEALLSGLHFWRANAGIAFMF